MTDLQRLWAHGRRPSGIALAAAAAAATLVVVAPYVERLPRQHLIEASGRIRPMVIAGAIALLVVLAGLVRERAGAWWASVGLVAAVASDTTPVLGGARAGVLTDLGVLALLLLVGSAWVRTRRGTMTAVYGTVIAAATAAATVTVLRLGYEPDLSFGSALLVVAVVSGVMALRRRFSHLGRSNPGTAASASREHGTTHIASTAEMNDRRVAILPSGHLVSFRSALGVAVAAGDPLGPRASGDPSVREYADLCSDNGVVPCVYQASPALGAAYRAAGMRLVKFGEEAIVDLDGYTLAVPRLANVRREVGRARRAGLSAQVLAVADVPALQWQQLEALSAEWELDHGGRELGFSMRRLRDLRTADAVVSIVTAPDRRVVAFTSWHPLGDGVGLDLMRRSSSAPPGAMDLSIDAELQAAHATGMRIASLGSVPMRDVVDDIPVRPLARRLRRWMYGRGASGYDYASLSAFKQKFGPRWESRMIAIGGGNLVVPLVVAALVRLHFAESRTRRRVPAGGRPGRGITTGAARLLRGEQRSLAGRDGL